MAHSIKTTGLFTKLWMGTEKHSILGLMIGGKSMSVWSGGSVVARTQDRVSDLQLRTQTSNHHSKERSQGTNP